MCFVCKKGDYQLTRYTKEERNKAREGFKRRVHQYLADNNIDDDFDKDITAIALNTLTLTAVPTTTSSNFFYNDYSVKHFITLNRLILIKTAKNIVTSINNNAFIYSLTSSIEPSDTEPSIVRRNNKGKNATYFCDNDNNDNPPDLLEFRTNINLDEPVNIENLTVDIDFLDCHFDDDGQDLALPPIYFSFILSYFLSFL